MRFKFINAIIMIILLTSVGCTSQGSRSTIQVEPTRMPPFTLPERTLTVLAASSLTDSFTELGEMFQEATPGVAILFNFGGSQNLAEQLNQGAPADVFASASMKYMDAAVQSKRVAAETPQVFAQNRLVVVYPKVNPAGISTLLDLAKPGLKLVLADKAVPVGQYSLDFLEKAVKDASFGVSYQADVLKNVVSYEDNVKSVLAKVVLGEADAGIVYVTDITADAKEQVDVIEIPDALNTIANYPIAAIADSQNADLAKAFIDLVLSAEGQAVLAKYGFIPVK